MKIISKKHLSKKEVSELGCIFESVNWLDTAAQSDKFIKSFVKNSSISIFAKDDNGQIAGYIRCLTDGKWQANIDCLVVGYAYQKHGYGTALMEQMMCLLRNVMFINICTDNPETKSFYERFRFKNVKGLYLQRKN